MQVLLSGSGVSPDTVSAGELAALLRELETAFQETAKGTQRKELPEGALVSLVKIERGSSALTFAIDEQIADAVVHISRSIVNNQVNALPPKAWGALREVWRQAAQGHRKIEFRQTNGVPVEHAVISEEREIPEVTLRTVQGSTAIFGHCVRVGGAEPKGVVVLQDNSRLVVDLEDTEAAKKLAAHLYEDVSLEGIATWDSRTWEFIDFRVTRILDYRPAAAVDAFAELARATGGRWKGIDAGKYVSELRQTD
jgi:hypothetical protein